MERAQRAREAKRAKLVEHRRAAALLVQQRRFSAKADRLASRTEQHRRRYSTPLVCRQCHREFVPPLTKGGRRRHYCSSPCARKASHRRSRLMRKPGTKKHTERAKKFGVPRCYSITPGMVYQRDRWICALCGQRIVRRLLGTNDEAAPSIDHIIPLSVQGSPGHVWSNVQAAHRRCNARKQAEVVGQLRMF